MSKTYILSGLRPGIGSIALGPFTPLTVMVVGVGDVITSTVEPPIINMTLDTLQVDATYTVPPEHDITLRWSDDAGMTWSSGLVKSVGLAGEYTISPTFYRLGMARSRIFEISWAGHFAEALTGAFVNFTIAGS